MRASSNVNWHEWKAKWVSYFDLLGFTNVVESEAVPKLISKYSQVLDECNISGERVERMWFSDTFLMYSDRFSEIEFASRSFIRNLLWRELPVRGSIAFGPVLTDINNNIIVGKPWIEAHTFGERYNWVGLVLCPSAQAELKQRSMRLSVHWKPWDAEFKANNERLKAFSAETVIAYKIGDAERQNGINVSIGPLKKMREYAQNDDIRRKYENTLQFLTDDKGPVVAS